MSILFPKLNKVREWDYRPIYYDEKKEERKERLKQLQEERAREEGKTPNPSEVPYTPSIHRGSFREALGRTQSKRVLESRKSNIRFFVIVLILLIVFFYFLY